VTLLILDPGLSAYSGHNGAMVEEFASEFADWKGFQWAVAGAATLRPQEFAHVRAHVQPVFQVGGYLRLSDADVLHDERLNGLLAAIVRDLNGTTLAQADMVLMPTAYPLHLISLASMADQIPARRAACGLLMPSSFWTESTQAADRLGELMGAALLRLAARTQLFTYSETGTYRFGESCVEVATMLPPLSSARIEQLAAVVRRGDCGVTRKLRFGFFGSPFTTKGFAVVVEAARHASPEKTLVRFCLPAGHDELCHRLNSLGGAIEARCVGTGNTQYFKEMADVDAVLAYYDPTAYSHKMSGVVTEAICLGKPLIVSKGCTAITTFLERYAPGAYAVGDYKCADLAAIFGLNWTQWQQLQSCALASSAMMREMKRMSRYLSITGVERPDVIVAPAACVPITTSKATGEKGANEVDAAASSSSVHGPGMRAVSEPHDVVSASPQSRFTKTSSPKAPRAVADGLGQIAQSLEADGFSDAADLVYEAAALLDLRDDELQAGWGGPFNNQQRRQAIFLEVLKRIGPKCIVETGTYRATTTVYMAQHFAGPIYTCEVDRRLFHQSRKKLSEFATVEILALDSRRFLHRLLQSGDLQSPVFFYLDAHWKDDLPLAEEVRAILDDGIEAIIMIDDFQVPFDSGYGFDNYGPGKVLNLEYLSFLRNYPVSISFPAAPAREETGARRGCVVICNSRRTTDGLSESGLLQVGNWIQWARLSSEMSKVSA